MSRLAAEFLIKGTTRLVRITGLRSLDVSIKFLVPALAAAINCLEFVTKRSWLLFLGSEWLLYSNDGSFAMLRRRGSV